jgi:DNA repair protein RecN (Recombination protein N)
VDSGGRSRAFVNGRPATVAQLRELGERLVDIHGQHDTSCSSSAITSARSSTPTQDAKRWHAHRRGVRRVAPLREQRNARESAQATSARERELVAHEIREIESLGFDARQWSEDQAEHRRLGHARELIDAVSACAEMLDESDAAVTAALAQASARLEHAASLDPELEAARRDVETAGVHASEAAQSLRRYLQRLEVDPSRLAEPRPRLQAVLDCARKHRVEAGEIPALLEARRARLAELGGEESLERLREQEAASEKAYRENAGRLSEARRGAATQLGMEVTRTMQRLAMPGGRFVVALEPLAEPAAGGLEGVDLQVSTHSGQNLAPLSRVASGGELSRISLALQVLLSGRASVPTLVFDEVDSGIGGAVAEIVGQLLGALSRHHQVLSVTHLAQVAVHAREQWRVASSPVRAEPQRPSSPSMRRRASTRSRACSAASRSPRRRAATPRKCCKTLALRVHLRGRSGPGGCAPRGQGHRAWSFRRKDGTGPRGRRCARRVPGGRAPGDQGILPTRPRTPFHHFGTVGRRGNAGALAVYADDFGKSVDNLLEVWRNFEPRYVYRSDFPGVAANSSRWLAGLFFGAFLKNKPISMLDNRPLESLLKRRLDFGRIAGNITSGALDAVAITCSGYTSGQSCSFYQGREGMEDWQRSTRIGIKANIGVEHLMRRARSRSSSRRTSSIASSSATARCARSRR